MVFSCVDRVSSFKPVAAAKNAATALLFRDVVRLICLGISDAAMDAVGASRDVSSTCRSCILCGAVYPGICMDRASMRGARDARVAGSSNRLDFARIYSLMVDYGLCVVLSGPLTVPLVRVNSNL